MTDVENAVWIDGVPFPSGGTGAMDDTSAAKLVKKARKHRDNRKNKLKEAAGGPGSDKAQKAYLGSTLVRLHALIEAAKRLNGGKRLPIDDYKKMAGELKLHQYIDEPARMFLKEKSSGGYRYFLDFGAKHRAAQAIVADMVRVLFEPKPFQYGLEGMGVVSAIKEVRNQFQLGYTTMKLLDIKSFFDSFDHAAILESLPIPKDIIEYSVIGRHLKPKPGKSYGGSHLATIYQGYSSLLSQRGLPQGSACSSIIAAFYMSAIKPDIPEGAVFLNYTDDFLVMAKSAELAEAATNALTASIEAMPQGNFKLLEKSGSLTVSGVEFLGYHLFEGDGGKLKVEVSEKNILDFQFKTSEYYEILESMFASNKSAYQPIEAISNLIDFACYVLSWIYTFSEADSINDIQDDYIGLVETVCDLADQKLSKILSLAASCKKREVSYQISQ